MRFKLILVVLAALCFASVLDASILIVTPTGATASSNLPSPNFRGPLQTIDGSGLSGAVPGTINSVSQLPKHNEAPQMETGTGNSGMWETDNGTGTTGWIVFDLGSVKTIDKIYVWNYAEVAFAKPPSTPLDLSNRGAKNVQILADNNPTPTTLIQSMVFNQAVNTPLASNNVGGAASWNLDYNTAADEYTLTTPIAAQYIKFNILSNQDGSNFVGLSEVRFGETVPEPASVSVIVFGMAVISRGRQSRCA